MRILVTGGAGYIGSVTCELLASRNHHVAVVDDLSRGHRAAVPPGIELHVASILDPTRLEEIFVRERPEGVLHFAASSQVGESMRDPGLYFRNNVGGIINLLDACVRTGCSRVLLSSSAATYGDPEAVPIPEEAPTRPTNPYGESKRIGEQILEWYRQVHGLRYASLRYFNAAGASPLRGEDHTPETHLIPLALAAARGAGPVLRVFGTDYPTPDGTCIRDYVHVLDLADAHILALEKLSEESRLILNLGSATGFSVLEIIQAVERVTRRRTPWEPAPRRPGDPPRLVASHEQARAVLGWNPHHAAIDTIIESAWRWMEAHPNGYGEDGERV